jgi:hypothetical protein
MVQINRKEFPLYELDNQDTIIQRISSIMKTIPKYLYFPEGIPTVWDGNIVVQDLLDVIKKSATELNFDSLYKVISQKIIQQNLSLEKDILYPFIAYNVPIQNTLDPALKGALILLIQVQIDEGGYILNYISVEDIERSRVATIDSIEEDIKKTTKQTKIQTKMFNTLQTAKGIPYTPFELERTSFDLKLEIPNISLAELFNYIQLNPRVPFSSQGTFYKILKDYIPPTEWSYSLEDAIVIKILQRRDVDRAIPDDYTDIIISIEPSPPGKEIASANMILDTSKINISLDEFINSFMDIFKSIPRLQIIDTVENMINGSFYFPHHQIDKYVLQDLIMNNPLFSSLMAIDESDKTTKKKNSIYIYFRNSSLGQININITEKISEKGDPILRGKDIINEFKYGSTYIRIKISRADNIASIQAFQNMFSKLMAIYDKEYSTIVEYYKIFIPTFASENIKKTIIDRDLRLKDIAPEVFIKGYPPTCPHQPTIISNDEVEEAEKNGKKVMRYPLDNNKDFPQHNYICNNPKAPYPGLRNNPLQNKNIVPYLPCCYEKDHSIIPGKIYGHYFKGEPLNEISADAGQQDFIITNKFVPQDKYGILPDDLTKMFDIYNYQEGYKFVRKGVYPTRSSFLECVLEGMWEQTGILLLGLNTIEDRSAYLYSLRDELSQEAQAASCKQEMYDFTTTEILNHIKNPDIYFDPKYFVSLLENYFKCNIYIFSRKKDTQLTLPRHIQSFYKTYTNKPCIFIYEHSGSKSDHSTYPRCELIVRWKVGYSDKLEYNARSNSTVCKGIHKLYNQLRQSYSLNISIPETIFPIEHPEIIIKEQGIDSYGKCRMITFLYNGVIGTILTSPIQPLTVPEIINWIIIPIEHSLALKVANLLKITITKQNIINDMGRGYSGILGNVVITIPTLPTSPSYTIPEQEQGVGYPESKDSALYKYNTSKKLARYITSYMLWLYSTYLQKENLSPSLKEIINFQQKFIEIRPNFSYGFVPKTFSIDSGVMYKGKLIVTSTETLKRLLYVLRITSMDNLKITSYHLRTTIDNYYNDVTDFDQYQFQVVLQGELSVDKWIQEHKLSYILHNTVQLQMRTPYFFQNILIGPDIYLAQNTTDISIAIHIYNTWNTKNYNPGEKPKIDIDIDNSIIESFTLYSYRNDKDITQHKIGKKNTNIKILGYKVQDESFFTILLQL